MPDSHGSFAFFYSWWHWCIDLHQARQLRVTWWANVGGMNSEAADFDSYVPAAGGSSQPFDPDRKKRLAASAWEIVVVGGGVDDVADNQGRCNVGGFIVPLSICFDGGAGVCLIKQFYAGEPGRAGHLCHAFD